jgi:hypothetical protein
MSQQALWAALAGAVVMLGAAARADDPVLPSPRPLAAPAYVPPSFVRPDPYAAWQNYAVDRRGYWRPMVVPSPDGPRYFATGDPYPWWKEHPRYFDQVYANTATFGGPAPRAVIMPAVPAPAWGWERMPYAED